MSKLLAWYATLRGVPRKTNLVRFTTYSGSGRMATDVGHLAMLLRLGILVLELSINDSIAKHSSGYCRSTSEYCYSCRSTTKGPARHRRVVD